MLTAERIDGKVVIDGEAEVDEVYPNVCCEGFGWRVIMTFYDGTHQRDNLIVGVCENWQCWDYETGVARRLSKLTPTELGERLCK